MATFAERLSALRNQRKVSQVVAAKVVKITPRTYQRYENDEREVSVNTLIRMADYFRVTTGYLMDRSDAR